MHGGAPNPRDVYLDHAQRFPIVMPKINYNVRTVCDLILLAFCSVLLAQGMAANGNLTFIGAPTYFLCELLTQLHNSLSPGAILLDVVSERERGVVRSSPMSDRT